MRQGDVLPLVAIFCTNTKKSCAAELVILTRIQGLKVKTLSLEKCPKGSN